MSSAGPIQQPSGSSQNPNEQESYRNQRQQGQQQPHHNPQQQSSDLSAVKLTRGTSCVLCQQRKVRCDKNKPCANCVKAKAECRVVPPQPRRRRKKRLQERDLVERLKKYEGLLSEHGVQFEPIGQDLGGDGAQGDDVDDLENDFQELKASPGTTMSSSAHSTGEKPPRSHFALHKEFRASEKLLHDSSDEEDDGAPLIHRAFDSLFSNEDGFPFVVGGSFVSVSSGHPNPIQIFQLWQVYIDNINSLLKITHIPSVQPQILHAASNLDKAPKNVEALMFGVYLMAVTSMEEADVQAVCGESKRHILLQFLSATQQALVNASFMRVEDPLVLQAFLLYLFAVRWFVDPRQVYCMIGMAVRIAQRMGLHRDPEGYGLPPFEVEQRRRLWWALVGYDRRIGEITGSTVTALSSGGDCKLPLNVNDSDLHMEGVEMPTPHTGPTEMLFSLTATELAAAVPSNSNRDARKVNSPSNVEGRSSSGPTVRPSIPNGQTYTLDGFCAHIEGTYLAHCEPKIPLHFFTLTMTRQALCKMRVLNFLVRLNNADVMPLKEIEREDLFLQATQMLEYDNVVQSSQSLMPFRWYARHYFPFPAYMFLVQELRSRVSGPMVERSWDAIALNYDLRGLINDFHSPMHLAFKNTFLKAWDARQAALHAAGKEAVAPRFIIALQEHAEQRRREHAERRPGMRRLSSSFSGAPLQGPASTTGSDNVNMTPPGLPGAPMGIGSGRPGPDSDGDMDWSYMVQGYQNPSPPFAGVGGYGGFRPSLGLGGMPGMGQTPMGGGGPDGPGMFGN